MKPIKIKELFENLSYVEFVKVFNIFQTNISAENLDGEVLSVKLLPNSTQKVYHNLRSEPQHRIILRQDAEASIYDGANWNSEFVEIVNPSSNTVNIKLQLLR